MDEYHPPDPPKCRHKYAPLVLPRNALRGPSPQGGSRLAVEAKLCRRCSVIRYRFWWIGAERPCRASSWGYVDSLEELVLGERTPPLKAGALGLN